jgi:predicted DNA-binding transcriptional regulator AlpA
MTLLTRAALLDKYGLRLTMEQCASVMGVHVYTVYNQIQRREFPIRTYKEGNRRFASIEAVAEYFDLMDEKAKEEFQKARA